MPAIVNIRKGPYNQSLLRPNIIKGIIAAPNLPMPLAHPNPIVLKIVGYISAVIGYKRDSNYLRKNLVINEYNPNPTSPASKVTKLNILANEKNKTREFFLPKFGVSIIYRLIRIAGPSPIIAII